MERLREAIERARESGSGGVGRLPADLPAFRSSRLRGVNRNKVAFTNLVYTETRVQELDQTHLEAHRVIAGLHEDERVEAYRQLRTQVLQEFDRHNWVSLAITSPHQDAGKTLTAVNLALSLSREVAHTVLLVDLDLAKPDVHRTLGVDVDLGVIDILEGRASVAEVLFNPSMPRIVVCPGRPLGKPASEMLSSPQMTELFLDMTTRYESRIVVFDLPPLLRNDDALKITPYADATLLVVEDGRTTPEDVTRCVDLLENANMIGTVLNKAT